MSRDVHACLRLGSEHGILRNPPLQDLAFRAVQIVTKAVEIAKQQLLAEDDESELADDPLLHFQHVRGFLKFAAAGAAFDVLDLHARRKQGAYKKVELICRAVARCTCQFVSSWPRRGVG